MGIFPAVLTVAALGGAGVCRGLRAARAHPELRLEHAHIRLPEMTVLLFLTALGTVGFVTTMTNYRLTWYLPVWVDLISMPLLWLQTGGLMAYIGGATAAVAWGSGHADRSKLALAAVAMVVAFGIFHVRYTRPIYPALGHQSDANGYVLQTSAASCAAASAANVARLLGRDATEREMARLAGTSDLGTTPGQVIRALRRKGLHGRKRSLSLAQLAELRHPAILLVAASGQGPDSHAVVLGPPAPLRLLIDPSFGPLPATDDYLRPIWYGHAIECWSD